MGQRGLFERTGRQLSREGLVMDKRDNMNIYLEEEGETSSPNALDVVVSSGLSNDGFDAKAFALSEFLGCDANDLSSYDGKDYAVLSGGHEGEEYKVLLDWEIQGVVRDQLESYFFDVGMPSGWEDYVDDDFMEETIDEYLAENFRNLSEDEVMEWLSEGIGLDEALEKGIIALKDGVDREDSDFDADDLDNYEVLWADWKLCDFYVEEEKVNQGGASQMFWDYGYGDDLDNVISDYMRMNNGRFPSWFDGDRLLDDEARDVVINGDAGNQLAAYDGGEIEFESEDGNVYMIYRMN